MSSPHEPQNSWVERPVVAALLRVAVFLLPVLASIGFITVATRIVARPEGPSLTVLWFMGLTAGAMGVVYVGDRALRSFLPVITLFRLSLVFPDRAPSRFAMAMRRNTIRQLQRAVADDMLDAQTPQEAAEHLLMLAAELNHHDRRTRGHTERVRAYALMIGEELRLPVHQLDRLHWAGLIHDVGKLQIPEEILNKEGRPDAEEWAILRSHPELGDHLIEPLREWLGSWADAASQHHEWWDGTGYPNGLAGEEISLSGRIVAVADAYDVITSTRSYKEAHSAEFARQELARGSGSQFEPAVVRAFMNIGLGRLRLVMGPLSWLSQLPVIGQTSLGPAIGTTAAAGVAVVTAAVVGLADGPAVDRSPEPVPGVEFIAPDGEDDVAANPAPENALTPATHVMNVTANAPASIRPGDEYDLPIVSLRILTPPARGTLTVDDAGVLLYEPEPGVIGEFEATIEVCTDVGTCFEAVVTILITASDGRPVPLDDVATTTEDTSVVIDAIANDADLGSPPLTLLSVDRPGGWRGDGATITAGSVHYEPAPDESGAVELEYTIADGEGDEATGRITVEVAPVNDPPSFVAGGDVVVEEDSGPRSVGWATTISTGPQDEADQTVSFATSVGDAGLFRSRPTIDDDGVLRFTPADDVEGSTDVVVTLTDDGGAADGGADTSEAVTFQIKIGDVNDPPRARADGIHTTEDSPVSFDVRVNDTDLDGDPLTVATYDATGLAHGTLASSGDGRFLFTPAPNAWGATGFTYVVADGNGGTDSGSVSITISAEPDAPAAANDSYSGTGNADLLIGAPGLLANDTDADGDGLSVDTTPVSGPNHGSLALRLDGSFDYRPPADWNGTDSFVYRVTDPGGLATTATVSIGISGGLPGPATLYLGNSGAGADEYSLTWSAMPWSDPELDLDGGGDPGLKFKKTNSGLAETDPDKYQHWTLAVTSGPGLALEGPVTLRLWSTNDSFHDNDKGHAFVWLHDCLGGSCDLLASTDLYADEWNGGVADWVYRELSLGSVTHKLEPGHTLRLRIQFDDHDAWVAMSGGRPSALVVTARP